MYLFGTLHVLKPGDAWSTPAIESALTRSEEIWTEVELSPVGMAGAQRLMRERGMAPDDEPLSGRLTPEQAQRLDATLRTYGLSRQSVERMRPWLAGLTLSLAPVMRAGYDPAAGVDRGVGAMGGVQGKKMRALETAEQQVDLLAGLSEPLQMQMLLGSIDEAARGATMVDALAAAWSQGDLETSARRRGFGRAVACRGRAGGAGGPGGRPVTLIRLRDKIPLRRMINRRGVKGSR